MRMDWGHQTTLRKQAQMPHYPLQIPHYLTLTRTITAVVESRRLTARVFRVNLQRLLAILDVRVLVHVNVLM